VPSVTDALSRVEAALADADADLTTDLGGHQEVTAARLWRGQVLVDWEPEAMAGGSLLRVDLLRRLVALGASVELDTDVLRIVAAGRVVAALSDEHAGLVKRLGGVRKVELRATLRFDAGAYRGGNETYVLIERGQRVPLLRVTADVRPRITSSGAASRRRSPGQS
jgi:hypothetical protein